MLKLLSLPLSPVLIFVQNVFFFLAPTGALEEGIMCVRVCVCACVCHFPQKNMEKEF